MLHNLSELAAMKGMIAIAWLCTLCASALGDGLSEYASPDAKLDYGRIFRPAQDLKMTETRKVKYNAQNQWKHSQRTPGHVVYGKPVFVEQPGRQRTSNKKFRPSPEDPFTGSEYAPLYAQKYASQLYTAQKNVGQLSDYQKYILNQDPEVKKFVFSPRVPKKVDTERSTAESVVVTTVAPGTIEKIKDGKEDAKPDSKLKSRKKQVHDSAAQSTSYKFVFKPEYVPVYSKDSLLYDQAIPYAPVTQFTPTYASGAHLNLDDHFAYKIPTTYVEKEEYPTKEPKYEFKYEVKDHEKNSNFGHTETRKGKTTWGKYYVQLSDGRFETVKYWADKTGYHAEVDFKGQARHPQTKPKEHIVLTHGLAAQDLKLYGHEATPHQFYAVSEDSPIGYH